jgi:hypothetical protein
VHVLIYPVKLAEIIRSALAMSKTPLALPAAAAAPPAIDLDTTELDQIIGAKGAANGGVYQFNVRRRDPITEGGMMVGMPAMGAATAINFQPTGGAKAAITGDFVLIRTEVNDVVRTLRSNGVDVTAIHNHMLTEQPRIIFMHFWAHDDAIKLAKALRGAGQDRKHEELNPSPQLTMDRFQASSGGRVAKCRGPSSRLLAFTARGRASGGIHRRPALGSHRCRNFGGPVPRPSDMNDAPSAPFSGRAALLPALLPERADIVARSPPIAAL